MVGTIMPLVKVDSQYRFARPSVVLVGLFALGSIASSAAVGGLIALLATYVRHIPSATLAGAIGLPILALVFCIFDLGILGNGPPGLRRQTCAVWWWSIGMKRAWLLWGFDLGTGVSTIRATSLFWMAALTALLLTPPRFAPIILSGYGLGIFLGLLFGAALVVADRPSRGEAVTRRMLYMRGVFRIGSAAVMLMWAVLLTAMIVT